MHRILRRLLCAAILAFIATGTLIGARQASAQSGEFFLQVSPSPLVSTLKPGQSTTLELKIRNASPTAESLTIAPRAFKITDDQQLELSDNDRPEIADWITFSEQSFSIKPGQTHTQKVTVAVPKEAGFSYSFALVINRAHETKTDSGAALKGSVAIFTLLNIDRPGATRKLEVEKFKTSSGIYEHLPTEFNIDFKNTGNTIVQPAGNIFIQRGSNDKEPIDTVAINTSSGYILPDHTRTLKVQWANGFPVTRTTQNADGTTSQNTEWDWSQFGNIRFGRYTAKMIAIYNDGQRDVPVEAEVSFWVIPWKILLGVLGVLLLIGFGLWSMVSKIVRGMRRIKR